jgi:hypothetical protein
LGVCIFGFSTSSSWFFLLLLLLPHFPLHQVYNWFALVAFFATNPLLQKCGWWWAARWLWRIHYCTCFLHDPRLYTITTTTTHVKKSFSLATHLGSAALSTLISHTQMFNLSPPNSPTPSEQVEMMGLSVERRGC